MSETTKKRYLLHWFGSGVPVDEMYNDVQTAQDALRHYGYGSANPPFLFEEVTPLTPEEDAEPFPPKEMSEAIAEGIRLGIEQAVKSLTPALFAKLMGQPEASAVPMAEDPEAHVLEGFISAAEHPREQLKQSYEQSEMLREHTQQTLALSRELDDACLKQSQQACEMATRMVSCCVKTMEQMAHSLQQMLKTTEPTPEKTPLLAPGDSGYALDGFSISIEKKGVYAATAQVLTREGYIAFMVMGTDKSAVTTEAWAQANAFAQTTMGNELLREETRRAISEWPGIPRPAPPVFVGPCAKNAPSPFVEISRLSGVNGRRSVRGEAGSSAPKSLSSEYLQQRKDRLATLRALERNLVFFMSDSGPSSLLGNFSSRDGEAQARMHLFVEQAKVTAEIAALEKPL